MEVTAERSVEIGENIKQLIKAMNGFSEEELVAIIKAGEHKAAFDPLLDPARYHMEGDGDRQAQTFLNSLLLFKRDVKGIGNCK